VREEGRARENGDGGRRYGLLGGGKVPAPHEFHGLPCAAQTCVQPHQKQQPRSQAEIGLRDGQPLRPALRYCVLYDVAIDLR